MQDYKNYPIAYGIGGVSFANMTPRGIMHQPARVIGSIYDDDVPASADSIGGSFPTGTSTPINMDLVTPNYEEYAVRALWIRTRRDRDITDPFSLDFTFTYYMFKNCPSAASTTPFPAPTISYTQKMTVELLSGSAKKQVFMLLAQQVEGYNLAVRSVLRTPDAVSTTVQLGINCYVTGGEGSGMSIEIMPVTRLRGLAELEALVAKFERDKPLSLEESARMLRYSPR